MQRLVESFLENATGLVVQLGEAAGSGDLEVLLRGSHTLKSNAASFGADDLMAICGELETRARAGSIEGADDLVRQITVEFEGVRQLLGGQG